MSYYRQRRRSRYTITFDHGGKTVILAYSADSARSYYEQRGRVVVSVERGDYRTAEDVAQPSGPSWTFNRKAIAEAFEAMTGQPLPSDVKFISDRRGSRTYGWFNYTKGAPTVKVLASLTPERANRTLWHELAHLAQFVRAGSPDVWLKQWSAVRAARYGYENRPWEIEAREWEVLAETDNLLNVKGA